MAKPEREALAERMAEAIRECRTHWPNGFRVMGTLRFWEENKELAEVAISAIEKSKSRIVYYPEDSSQ